MQDDDDQTDDALSDEDYFRQQMRGVTPLKADNRVQDRPPPKQMKVRQYSSDFEDEDRFASHTMEEANFDDVPEILSFSRPGIQHSKLAKLRQGKLHIEESIDLHGSTVKQAREYLIAFLAECREHHRTVVRVVHGKGNRSRNKLPVIKAMLNRWLREAPEVLAFHSAPQHDGGTGAVYVLLKR